MSIAYSPGTYCLYMAVTPAVSKLCLTVSRKLTQGELIKKRQLHFVLQIFVGGSKNLSSQHHSARLDLDKNRHLQPNTTEVVIDILPGSGESNGHHHGDVLCYGT